MNYLKIVEVIAGILICAGFILLAGAVGTCDYMDEIGQYYPITQALPQMILGLVLFGAGGFCARWLEDNFNYYEQEEGEEE